MPDSLTQRMLYLEAFIMFILTGWSMMQSNTADKAAESMFKETLQMIK